MYQSSSTPKHNVKVNMYSSFQQKGAGQQPSTPQKFSIMKNNLKVLNIPSQSDTSFRSSSQKKLLTSESPQVHQKENGLYTKRPSQDQNQLDKIINENKKLNEFIQKQYKEKQDLMLLIERYRQGGDESFNLFDLQERVERLERVIDSQATEIEEWKQKYSEACDSEVVDQRVESQIMSVVEENERLNNMYQTKVRELEQLERRFRDLESVCSDIELQNQEQTQKIILLEANERIYQDRLLNEEKEKAEMQKTLESLNQQFDYIQNSFVDEKTDNSAAIKCLTMLEQQLSEVSSQYTFTILDNQKLHRSNNMLREELANCQKVLDEFKSSKLPVNPKFQEINKCLRQLKDKLE